jgi:hypothetical protein|tara:strand:+ start:163 stop:384 length:222 start_codon:yes stop_codon:yes gene_type:complete
MKYDDIDCGLRVMTSKGPGVVKSFDATFCLDIMGNRGGGFVSNRHPLTASVWLDDGPVAKFRISKLKKLKLKG